MADGEETELSRRDVIRLGAAATLAASLGVGDSLAAQSSAAAASGAASQTFFTPDELALVDELSELIIPTDDHSPGARAARVAAYIDSRLAEAWEEHDRTDWREGLKRIDQLSQESSGKPFMQSSADQRLAVLTRI
nr:gluconate 2-dehydrogenase subunit 3 family protein [Acidobacteriota bacterium]